ncbi:MAG TPA: response regulator [Candidatus Binataceae bacterium]|nr:response regulator [Candidatus Binataceae bacterium]
MTAKALLIDDSAPARSVLRRRLEQIGCEVLGEAGDAVHGLELFRKLHPNLIILDLIMPQTDQFDAMALLKVIRKESPDAAVVVISAQPRASAGIDFMREGALAYLEKPFIDFKALVAALSRAFPDLNTNPLNRSSRRL